ncbi:winged helix-turn-helix transcriptional regulator [Streptacidiphilus sp. MAP5-52]|uniref:winged helix-turn-helix transcriptional regulator n=1 Tax=Streptacidiphilus sp. MAP5-52 TaxID=3156267 RepID=UPI0035181186
MSVVSSPSTQAMASQVQAALEVLSPKWTLASLAALRRHQGEITSAQLLAELPWASSGSLSSRVATMERDGLITKRATGLGRGRLLRLTPAGRGAEAVSHAAAQWGSTHLDIDEDQPSIMLAERTLNIISRSHTTAVLWELENGPAYPSEIIGLLPRYTNSTLMYQRLDALVGSGLLTRSGEPRRWQYELTDGARQLRPLYQSTVRWARERRAETVAAHPASQSRSPLGPAAQANPAETRASAALRTSPALRMQFSDAAQQPKQHAAPVLQGTGATRRR